MSIDIVPLWSKSIPLKGPLYGFRTDAWTGEKREVRLSFEIKIEEKGAVFYLIGGPTGYESFYIDLAQLHDDYCDPYTQCWVACMGTKERWDRLEIPADEMRRVFDLDLDRNPLHFVRYTYLHFRGKIRRWWRFHRFDSWLLWHLWDRWHLK